MEDTQELLNSQNEQEQTETYEEEGLEGVSDTQTEEVDVEALRQQNRELYARAKKAEGFVQVDGKWVKPAKSTPKPAPKQERSAEPTGEVALSPKDYLALTENKVTSDDFDEVMRLSTVLGKTVAETLKDKTAKIILSQRAEERATAAAAAATPSKRGNAGQNREEKVLKNFESGVKPLTEEDSAQLAEAQFARLNRAR